MDRENIQKLINNFLTENSIFPTSNIMTEIIRKARYKQDGWKEYYDVQKDKHLFIFDYGKKYHTNFLINNNSYYVGEINLAYEKHGYGKLVTKEGNVYEGTWKKDEFTGWGTFIECEKNFFVGIFFIKKLKIKKVISD